MTMVGKTIKMIAENIPFKFLEYAVVNCPSSAGSVMFSFDLSRMDAKYYSFQLFKNAIIAAVARPGLAIGTIIRKYVLI